MSRDTVIFDGGCGVCMALKDWAAGRDSAGKLEFIAFQEANLAGISAGLTPEMASQALYSVCRDSRRFRGARAVFETMRRLPGVWGTLGKVFSFALLNLLAEPVYRLFARYRGTISQWLGLDRCALPRLDRP